MSKARQERRREQQEQRRDERSQRKAQGAGSRRNVWLALGGALAIGVVLVGAFVISSGEEGSSTAIAAADGTSTSTSTSASTTASAASIAPAGDTATTEGSFPIVAYQDASALGATELDFTELLGTGTPVVLNFWAGQCPPCRAEMPAFQRVYDANSDDFLLVGVDIGPYIGLGSRESAIDLLAELGITYPTAGAADARAVAEYQILGMPTTIFYDGDGVEVDRHSGLLTEDALAARVRDLVEA